MRTAVLAAALAFRAQAASSPLPGAARHLAARVFMWLDQRRERIDGERHASKAR